MLIDLGLSREEFRQRYADNDLYLRRGGVSHNLFSMRSLDQALYCTEPVSPFIRLHNGVDFIPEQDYVEVFQEVGMRRRRIIRPKFYEFIRGGATLLMNRIESRSTVAQELCLEISALTGFQTLANAYFSVGNRPSFGNHWDTHDVFAVQLHGRKHWKVYRPTYDFPVAGQTSRDHKHEVPAEPVLDTILEAGDVLYIPRGWWHCATAVEEETIHFAIGVHPPHVVDYLGWLCSKVLPEFISCRQVLHADEHGLRAVERAVGVLADAALSHKNFDAFLDDLMKSDRVATPFETAAILNPRPGQDLSARKVRLNAHFRIDRIEGIGLNGIPLRINGAEHRLAELLASHEELSLNDMARLARLPYSEVEMAVLRLVEGDAARFVVG